MSLKIFLPYCFFISWISRGSMQKTLKFLSVEKFSFFFLVATRLRLQIQLSIPRSILNWENYKNFYHNNIKLQVHTNANFMKWKKVKQD